MQSGRIYPIDTVAIIDTMRRMILVILLRLSATRTLYGVDPA